MRQYVHELPWWAILLWASTNTVYFQDSRMTKARNFLPVSMMCLYNSPFMWIKVSNSWWGDLLFSNHLEMHLQNGSFFCICSNASKWSAVSGFGIVVGSWEIWGSVSGYGVEVALEEVCCVWLLVWKAGPSVEEAVIMLTDVEMGFTNLERQSAALFLAPKIHLKVVLYATSSRLHWLTLLLVFFSFRNYAEGFWSFYSDVGAL